MRLEVHAVPGAKSPGVGGSHGGALVVRVGARAIDGRATEAVRRAVADALGVPARDVTLLSGATSRRKVFSVSGDQRRLEAALEGLLGGR